MHEDLLRQLSAQQENLIDMKFTKAQSKTIYIEGCALLLHVSTSSTSVAWT